MAIASLNEAYSQNSIVYLCNACGEINNPDNLGDLSQYQPEDVMTPREQILYENYWTEDGGCCRYVLRLYDQERSTSAAMGLSFLFDRTWCRDIITDIPGAEADVPDDLLDTKWMPRLFLAISDATKTFLHALAPGCDFYIGQNTDPDGHVLLVVIPYEIRDQINAIAERLNDAVYDVVGKCF